MNKLPIMRAFAAGVMALSFLGWTGTVKAAEWANPGLLLSANSLKQYIDNANWAIVDCRDLKAYAKGHIPGAISLGKRCKKALRDATARAWRDNSKYEKLLGKVGIGNDTHVVFYYDGLGTITDATVGFWILEYLGHDKTHVLNGGLDAWRKAGNRLEAKPTIRKATTFKVNVKASAYGATDEILRVATGSLKDVQLIDSRTSGEFSGKDMRALRGGHVPNVAINVSHLDTLAQAKDAKTGKMKPTAYFDADVVAAKFASLDKNKRTVAYCQTGTRSTMTYLQLRLLGFKDPANWDESWRVYGSTLEFPVANEQWYNFGGVNKALKKVKALEKKIKALEAK